MVDKSVMRARDFWTALVLIAISLFFLYQTSLIPFFQANAAGVQGRWYNSAALVPFGIFSGLLILALVLLAIAIFDGGARQAFSSIGIGYSPSESARLLCISAILAAYIFGLVPRVDFIICSALVITALIWGFRSGDRTAMATATIIVICAAAYALLMHFPRAEWTKPHDDDIATLVAFVLITILMFVRSRMLGRIDRITRLTPMIAILVPALLVIAMAFGFRQNVPNRQGLLFSKIEYHYYVNIKPLWSNR
ncbi:MAG: hypothetical protein NXI27_25060 [Alphaproteobacteria bacterium]|nr:hypothetical protein [Alphaproteobacteria bacterium]